MRSFQAVDGSKGSGPTFIGNELNEDTSSFSEATPVDVFAGLLGVFGVVVVLVPGLVAVGLLVLVGVAVGAVVIGVFGFGVVGVVVAGAAGFVGVGVVVGLAIVVGNVGVGVEVDGLGVMDDAVMGKRLYKPVGVL